MTVFNNRRQENICCYNNLEWQLMIGRAAAVRAEFQRLGYSVSVATVDLHLSGIIC